MKSKELREIEAEEMEREPSLDKLINLNDPKVLMGLGRLAKKIQEEKRQAENSPPSS
jgi:hypothetical protein